MRSFDIDSLLARAGDSRLNHTEERSLVRWALLTNISNVHYASFRGNVHPTICGLISKVGITHQYLKCPLSKL
jgi:hypothetical protein